ncbi:MAG: tetratricopeptide repeat protein, partial [Candidatus Kariarchaeaceae archaeon]
MTLAQSQVNYHEDHQFETIDWLQYSKQYSGDPYQTRFCLINLLESPLASPHQKFSAYSGLGRINCEIGNYSQALYNFQRSGDYSPSMMADWNDLKNIFGEDTREVMMQSTYDIIMDYRLDKEDPLTWVVIGINYMDARQSPGRFNLGIRCFIKALQKDPMCLEAWTGLHKAYEEMGGRRQAKMALQKIGQIRNSYS